MANKSIYFLVHKVDEDFTRFTFEDVLHHCEWKTCPSKRIYEGKCWDDPRGHRPLYGWVGTLEGRLMNGGLQAASHRCGR